MADINKVDYMQMKKQISVIYSKGAEMQKAMQEVYKQLTTVNKIWTGAKCNNFLKIWNSNVNGLITYSRFLEYDLSVYLTQVASRFSKIDGTNISQGGYGWGHGLNEVKLPETATLRFITNEVKTFQQILTRNFTTAIATVDEIYTKVNALPWDSTSSQTFLPIFKSVSTKAKESINQVYTAMNKTITETQSDVQTAEATNKKQGENFGGTK